MRHAVLLPLLCTALLIYGADDAAPAATPAAPAVLRPVSPELLSDGSATFRFHAPNAKEVLIDGEWSRTKTPLTKDPKGIWSVTLKFPPELYQYRFVVDGASVPDPNNRFVKSGHFPYSLIDVPAATPRPFDRNKDVARGSVITHSYFSKTLNVERRVRVYVPPGELKGDDKLPVLYLLHGSTDNEASWTTQGRADVIADNLLAAGKMKKMLIVMPDGHAEEGPSSRDPAARRKAYERLEADVLKEIIPLVEKNYHVYGDSKHRALIGLSMGGAQTAFIGLSNSDRFAWLGIYSQGILETDEAFKGALAHPAEVNANLKWFWIGMGREDARVQRARDFSAKLTSLGIRNEYHETDGAHTWQLWRTYLNDCLPQLFR